MTTKARSLAIGCVVVWMAASACATDEAPYVPEPTDPRPACCSCACSDGAQTCDKLIVESEDQVSCDQLCGQACADSGDCTLVETASLCVDPRPLRPEELLCRAACQQARACGAPLEDGAGNLIPTDDCDRTCGEERFETPRRVLACVRDSACAPSMAADCWNDYLAHAYAGE